MKMLDPQLFEKGKRDRGEREADDGDEGANPWIGHVNDGEKNTDDDVGEEGNELASRPRGFPCLIRLDVFVASFYLCNAFF